MLIEHPPESPKRQQMKILEHFPHTADVLAVAGELSHTRLSLAVTARRAPECS
jgi:hypothetical protein